MGLLKEIKYSYREEPIHIKLIYINLFIFLIVNIIIAFIFLIFRNSQYYIAYFQNEVIGWLMVPASISKLIIKPWSIITYMFLHINLLHILFNLLWLYMFGRLFLIFFNEKQLLGTYFMGGIFGAFLFVIAYNVFPGLSFMSENSQMLGASAAIMAVAMAVSFYSPDYTVYLLLIGPVRLKYIALFFIITDILQIASYNAGGHIAHLGGVIYAFYYILQIKKGKDLSYKIGNLLMNIKNPFKRKRSLRVSYKKSVQNMDDYEYNQYKAINQKEIDRILEKISKYGYDSLTKKEKEILFRYSKKE